MRGTVFQLILELLSYNIKVFRKQRYIFQFTYWLGVCIFKRGTQIRVPFADK